jgi:hypothetical protein
MASNFQQQQQCRPFLAVQVLRQMNGYKINGPQNAVRECETNMKKRQMNILKIIAKNNKKLKIKIIRGKRSGTICQFFYPSTIFNPLSARKINIKIVKVNPE